jgi:hypothetical protein
MPGMNDRPAASMAFWFASEIMPAPATIVTSGSWRAAMNFSMAGSIVWSLLYCPRRRRPSGEPVAACEQADRDLRLQAPFLGEPGLAEAVALVGLEVERGHVVEDEAGRAGRARRRLPAGPAAKPPSPRPAGGG